MATSSADNSESPAGGLNPLETPPQGRRKVRTMVWIAAGAGGVAALLLVGWLVRLWTAGGPVAGQKAVGPVFPVSEVDPQQYQLAAPRQRIGGVDPPPLTDVAAAFGQAVQPILAVDRNPDVGQLARTGRLGGTGEVVERAADRNWEIRFLPGSTAETYAKELDFFGIELAVVQPDGQLLYVTDFSTEQPHTKQGPAADEKRYYLTWRGGEMPQADRDVLGRAQVETEGRVVLKLLPPELEAKLAKLERDYAGEKAEHIRKTRFGIKAEGNGYTFYVLQQWYK